MAETATILERTAVVRQGRRLWWADVAAGVIMVPIIAKEGIEGLTGRACNECGVAGDDRFRQEQAFFENRRVVRHDE